MPPAADNPDGFWENLRFVALNDELLSTVGAAWDLPPWEAEAFSGEAVDPLRAKAGLLIDSFKGESTWGWKDPRNSLTLPFWERLLPGLKTIIMVRNPLEVAYSMHKRNGTSYALGLRLWELYNRRVLTHTRAEDRIITNYQAFFDHPEQELGKIAAFAGLPESEVGTAAQLVATDRRHTSFTVEQLIDAGVSQQIITLYQDLTRGAAGPEQTRSTPADRLSGTASKLNARVPDAEDTRRELAARRGDEIKFQVQLETYQKTVDELHRELAAKSVAAAAEINRREGRIEELQNAYAHLDRLLQREYDSRNKLLSHRDTLQKEHSKLLADFDRLVQELAQLRQSHEGTLGELAQVRESHKGELEQVRQAHEGTLGELAQVRESHKGELEQVRQAHEGALSELVQARESHKGELEQVRQAHEGTLGELAQVRQRFTQTNQLLQDLSVRLFRFETRNTSLTDRLRKQLLETKKLLRLLDQIEDAAVRLRHSRRWKIANPFGALRAALAGKPVEGFGHLDKNVDKYHSWRTAHPEIKAIDQEIQSLRTYEAAEARPGPSLSLEAPITQAESAPAPRPPAPPKPIAFPTHEEVEVSIIVPVYNQVDFTLSCLAAVQDNSGSLPYEVIVVDDCSTDATPELVAKLPGVTYLRSESNAGFISSCNRGAAAARGKYLVFLNNDTTVTDGWLTALHETFREQPRAGLVGSKLVYPDGRLQEAGGIIWRDGSGWNRGKFQDPASPEYNYLREMDYCSAASVMIPRELFMELGGFDRKYAPAYYEDTDLSFKVAARGLAVLYQPLSIVIHHEGITGGTDLSAGAKKYQAINRSTFTNTWASVLAKKPENGDLSSWEQLTPGGRRILVIDHHLPMADKDSGSLRMFQILKILHHFGHRITFLPDNLADIPPYGDRLRRIGIEVMHHPYCKSVSGYLGEHGRGFDVIILSRCDFAVKHISAVRHLAPQAFLIFDTVDLHFLRQEREAALFQSEELKEGAKEKRQLEYDLIRQADQTWVVSPTEQALLREAHPNSSIEVVSNIVDTPGSATPFPERRDILFIGSFQHPPNVDAVLYFIQEIFPLVQARSRDIRLYIIGGHAPPSIVALASEQIIVAGYQPDVRLFFDTIRLSVAPLRYGAGVKGKINQSMGLGVPVVATSMAVEGMNLVDGEDILRADTPDSFADAVVKLYESEELWNKISANGLENVKRHYSVAAAETQLRGSMKLRPPERLRSSGLNAALERDSAEVVAATDIV